MMDRLTARSAILLSLAAVLVVGLVGWFVFVSPQRSEAASLAEEITAMQVRLDLAERVKQSDNPEERAVQLRRLEIVMPAEPRMPQILRQLDDAARAARVRIDGITPSPAVPTGGHQTIPISLAVDGHYFPVASFLQLLRTRAEANGEEILASGRLYSVDSINFGASGVAANTGRISATIGLNAFTYTAAPVTAPVTPTAPDTTGSAAGAEG